MPSFSEMNYKVEVSIGLLIFIIAATFAVTNFYIKQNTLESRMDKRHKRTEERIDKIETDLDELRTIHTETE